MNQNLLNLASENMTTLHETAWRMVEAQHISATRKLVDSVREQEILEEIIESTKPKTFGKEFTGLHVLLFTPFRYPSLPQGSRFANQAERSIWYGSLNLSTVLAEKAYYQFLFLRASHAKFGNVLRTFTAFSAQVKTERGVDLTQASFCDYAADISSPLNYEVSQALGTALREQNIEALKYQSARDPMKGTNVALLVPKAFSHKKPQAGSFQTWHSLTNETTMEFMRTSALVNESKMFSVDQFYMRENVT